MSADSYIFVTVITTIVLILAFRNTKPITKNHGTIHNHYYSQEEKGKSKVIDDEQIILVTQIAVEMLKATRQEKEEKSTDCEDKLLEK